MATTVVYSVASSSQQKSNNTIDYRCVSTYGAMLNLYTYMEGDPSQDGSSLGKHGLNGVLITHPLSLTTSQVSWLLKVWIDPSTAPMDNTIQHELNLGSMRVRWMDVQSNNVHTMHERKSCTNAPRQVQWKMCARKGTVCKHEPTYKCWADSPTLAKRGPSTDLVRQGQFWMITLLLGSSQAPHVTTSALTLRWPRPLR